MTYPFETIGVKKSEILPIIRQFIPAFKLDLSHQPAPAPAPAPAPVPAPNNESGLEIDRLKLVIQQLEKKLEEIESKYNFIDIIMNEDGDNFAPDLFNAICLYRYVYIDNPKDDSHSNKAKRWISVHTKYSEGSQSFARLTEVATPLHSWGAKRDRGYKN